MPFDLSSQGSDALQTFIQQNYDTQLLIIIGLALFVGLQFIRSFGNRDKTLNTVVTQLSLVISQQGKTLDSRDEEYRTLFKEISDRNAKADQLHIKQIEALGTVSTQARESLKEIEQAQTKGIEALIEHDQWAQGSVKNIMDVLGRIEQKVETVHKSVGEIKAFFPENSRLNEQLRRVEKELAEAIEELKDCNKRASDERPTVTLPIERKSEDAATSGVDGEAA